MLSTMAILMLAVSGSMAAYQPNSTVAVANNGEGAFNCVGLTVGSVEEAIKFYTEGLEFHVLAGPLLFTRGSNSTAAIFSLYNNTNVMNLAWLGAANNGIGLELFEFVDPPYVVPYSTSVSPSQKHWKIGLNSKNTTALTLKAVAAGGTLIGDPIPTAGAPTLHVLDPWGNLVEILPSPYEVAFGDAAF
ncbi:hypothetical protein BUE80_DR001044 [Diplocarpon rosae]|nr:hypothetical protein BUE80_DR001044 [Diplocarpon rosae]